MLQKTTLLILLLFIYGNSLYSQRRQEIDSLKVALIKADISEKAAISHKLVKLYRLKDTVQQLFYARKTVNYSKEARNQKYQGIGTSEIGRYYLERGNLDSAYHQFSNALPYFQSNNTQAITYSLLSTTESKRGNFKNAIQFLIKSDSLFSLENNKRGMISSKINLSAILTGQEDYKVAILYLEQAEQLISNKSKSLGTIYFNMSNNYIYLGDTINAKKYVTKSILIRDDIKDSLGLAYSYSTYAKLIDNVKDFDVKILYLKKSLDIFKKIGSNSNLVNSYLNLGNIYRENRDFNKAEYYLLIAQELSNKNISYEVNRSLLVELQLLYQDQKKWKKAHTALLAYNSFKDSIINIEKLKITKDLQTKYETDRILKDKELAESNEALAEEKAENNKSYAIAIALLGALIFAITILLFYRFKSKKKQEALLIELQESEKRLKLEQQTRVSELKALQAQMNPHFVFNALNSIQDLILLQDIRNSNKYLGKFSDLIRQILAASSSGNISINEELVMLQLYAELEQLRFGNQLQINFKNDVSETISDDFMLPPMFIQPYIENALKHGLRQKEGDKVINVQFYIEDRFIVCKIEDNGIGREKAKQLKPKGTMKHLGFSTEANQERVDLLNAQKTEKIRIEIIDKTNNNIAEGTTVFLYFPFYEM